MRRDRRRYLAGTAVLFAALAGSIGAKPRARWGHVVAQTGASQTGAGTAAASPIWADENLQVALDELMPMDRPDPATDDRDFITYRFTNRFVATAREYSFSLMRRTYEAEGPLRSYWVGRIRMADGAPIRAQLMRLHAQNPDATVAALEPQIKIRSWDLTADACPVVRLQATKFLFVAFKAPFSSDSIANNPLFEFQVSSLDSHMKLALSDADNALVAWAMETRRALAGCGAPESAPMRGEN